LGFVTGTRTNNLLDPIPISLQPYNSANTLANSVGVTIWNGILFYKSGNLWKYSSNNQNYNPCSTVSEIFHSSEPDYVSLRCYDFIKMKFDGVVVNYVDGRGQDYSFYPYLWKGNEFVKYDIFTNSFSGTIWSVIQGYGNSLVNMTPSNAIIYNINDNVWTGLIANVLQGYGNHTFGNGNGTISTYIICPLGATRNGNRCYHNFNQLR